MELEALKQSSHFFQHPAIAGGSQPHKGQPLYTNQAGAEKRVIWPENGEYPKILKPTVKNGILIHEVN